MNMFTSNFRLRAVLSALFVFGAGCASFGGQQLSPEQYSPATDPSAKKLPRPQFEKWNASYMWYAGQYASYCHRRLAAASVERCSFVNDGGTYYAPQKKTFFRRGVELARDTSIKWRTPQVAEFFVDGKRVARDRRGESVLGKGRHVLEFGVAATDRLPCVIVEGDGVSSPDGWQASLDGKTWTPAESGRIFDDAFTTPDRLVYDVFEIRPSDRLLSVNCQVRADKIAMGKNSRIVLDFRHDELGSVALSAKGSGRLRFHVGESVAEVVSDDARFFEQKPLPSFELTGGTDEIVLPTAALRYLRIESDGGAEISNVVFRAELFPMNRIGSFRCSDEKFNRIIAASAATIHTSTRDFYLDGIKRDCLPWPLDAVETTLAADYIFDADFVSRNSYALSLLSDKPTVYDTGILDYPLHALIGFKHDFSRYGDISVSLRYKDRILQLLKLYESALDGNGFLPSRPTKWGMFLPAWSKRYRASHWNGTPAYVQIMLYENWKIASEFFGRWGDAASAEKYRKMAGELRAEIVKHFWDEKRGAFINGYDKNGKPDTEISHYAQYWAILAGIFPESAMDNLFEKVLPDIPLYYEDISIEKGYEMLAYIKAGRTKEAFDFVRKFWGQWLDEGHTRFPENLSPTASPADKLKFYGRPFGLSLCHASFGAPPIIVAVRGLCGFRETANPDEYVLEPNLAGLKWIEGEIPLKQGILKYRFEEGGKFDVSLPKGATAAVKFGGKTHTITSR